MANPSFDYTPNLLLDLARGKVGSASAVLKFGRNADVDTGASGEDIWDRGGGWQAPTTVQGHNIVSTNTADTSSGSGARTVEIFGLDANYEPQSETISLNGTTNVPTVGSYLRIFRMIVRTAGANGINDGDITACAPTDDTVTAQISASFNQTLMAIYTIPASTTGYITNYYGSMNRNNVTGATDLLLKIEPFGETLQTKHIIGMIGGGTSQVTHTFGIPFKVNEKSDIRMRAIVTSDNTDVSAGFDLVLVNEA